ncbi:DUF4352 domain-containing protein [Paenibacillus sp. D2_2]|uniref:DUF4352 domain-containing protein n=1 Tax=Paenibacillus sp. D2_2 TaxID=3073092 RepID=UPI00281673BA|nr:DUF4352 domain-containing protein [Paenibacillus sp. D2_2]WMT42856.1 DUF4352 domain-containing protein [Paenibacillus sp. D2_2]
MEQAKKKWYKRWWVWLIIVLVIGAIGSNIDSKDAEPTTKLDNASKQGEQNKQDKQESKNNDSTKIESVKTEKEDKNNSDKNAKEENRTITAAGEGIETKNFKISVVSVDEPESDNMFIAPSEGSKFVAVNLVIENISKKDYTVSSMLMFEAYQDGFSINEDITAHAIKGYDKTMDGSLAAGKKIKGSLVYELPKDWKELEIDIDLTKLSFSTDGEVKILLQNK